MPHVLVGPQGAPVRLGAEIARGGEGTIYEVLGEAGLVAKVYHTTPPPRKGEKLGRMAEAGGTRLRGFTAWPAGTLHERARGPVRGILMPRVQGHKEAHLLYSPRSRKQEFDRADYRFIVHAAANVARAFAALHAEGHVVGDVNHSGVLVSPQATATLIDCDSFQVRFGADLYECEVGVPEYTPPELQGRPFIGVVRTPNHDTFGLAVMVFHLLFMGRHPFSGTFLGRGDMPLARAIAEHRFAYGARARERQMRQPPGAPALETVSPALAHFFERAFGPGLPLRPTSEDWVVALSAFERELKACDARTSHTYYRGLAACPWCVIENQTGLVLFFVPGRHGSAIGFAITRVWAQISAVQLPPAPALPVPPEVKPSQAALAVRRGRWAKNGTGVVLLVFGGVLAVIGLGTGVGFVELLAIGLAWFVGAKLLAQPEAVKPFKERYHRAKEQRDALFREWIARASGKAFEDELTALRRAYDEYGSLEAERQRELFKLQQRRKELQRQHFLERHRIASASIRGIGPSRKATLLSFGVETAADVDLRRIVTIPGFGYSLASNLVTWRAAVERRFTFDPTKGVDPRDTAAVNDRFDQRKAALERRLAGGTRALTTARAATLAAREELHSRLTRAVADLAQAEADVRCARGRVS